jgi:hypothetical protein
MDSETVDRLAVDEVAGTAQIGRWTVDFSILGRYVVRTPEGSMTVSDEDFRILCTNFDHRLLAESFRILCRYLCQSV